MNTNKFDFNQIIATVFYLGYTPITPGTAASLATMLALYFLPPLSIITSFIILNILFFVGTVASERSIIQSKDKDPSFVVIDEWFGMWLSLFLLPKSFILFLVAFVIFRFFDILKPWPISQVEKQVPGGLGIMLDDATAGFFTFVIMQAISMFL